jgi:hypothetical protein|tara:strand:+ start:2243 stop:2536 length:294 start_codon:yes stop_codon:yes gene_type:complete
MKNECNSEASEREETDFLLKPELISLPGIVFRVFDKGTVATAFFSVEGVGKRVTDRHLFRVLGKHRCPAVGLDQRHMQAAQAQKAESSCEKEAALQF